jgi:hypothetical protein
MSMEAYNLKGRVQVGDVLTSVMYTDRRCWDVIGISPSGARIVIRERTPIKVVPQEMVPGGFTAVVIKNAVWRTVSDPAGYEMSANWSAKRGWYKCGYGPLFLGDSYHYDYGY